MTTPIIENVEIQASATKIYVDMDLACIPVTVIGQYNIHSNSFYPSTIFPTIRIVDGTHVIAKSTAYSVGAFCELMEWDTNETYDAIQQAVENRE